MATLTIRNDLAQQFQDIAHHNHSTLDDLFEELLALYEAMNPQVILSTASHAPDSEAYIGSLGSMCSVGEGDLSPLSASFREIILGDSPESNDDPVG